MLGYYTPLLILQAICLFHAYKNNVEQRWYWLILFIPLVGCLLYLYDAFYTRNAVHTITQGVKQVINSNYKIEQLEQAVRFAGNVTNKTQLANAYAGNGRYDEAIALYKECLQGFMAGDPNLRMKLLQANFLKKDYAATIAYGDELESQNEKNFKNAEARVAYAWALHYAGNSDRAEVVFKNMDNAYTNYWHRMEYGKFLKEINKPEELNAKLETLIEEFNHIKGPERKLYRSIIAEAKALYRMQQQMQAQATTGKV